MICEQIRDQLVDTARGRDLSSDFRAGVFAHAAVCRDCARLLENQTQLTMALSDLSLQAESAPARFEQILRRQLPAPKPQRKSGAWLYAGIAAGFAILALTGALVLRPVAAVVESPAPAVGVVAPGLEAAPQPPEIPVVAVARGIKKHARAMVTNQDTVDSDSFIPLPYAPEVTADEPTNIVRVAFSRESLLAVGVPVSGNRYGEQVEADVLLGMDGTARAIRLTNE